MRAELNKILRKSYNKYLVRHVQITNDDRCRTEIMFEEMTNDVIKLLKKRRVKSKNLTRKLK